MDYLIPMFMFMVLSIVSWVFTLNNRIRREHSKPASYFFRMNKEQRQALEAASLAAALTLALLFTIIFIFLLIASILEMLR
jgi:hypothetical protein